MSTQPDFSKAFLDGRTVDDEYGPAVMPSGKLVCVTGEIIACDPQVTTGGESFVPTLSPGRNPVLLSVATIGNDQRVAYAKIQISDQPAARWQVVYGAGQDPQTGANLIVFSSG